MRNIKDLGSVANQAMGGLEAGEDMWKAIEKKATAPRIPVLKRYGWVPAAVCAVAAALVLLIGGPGLNRSWDAGSNYTAGSGKEKAAETAGPEVSVSAKQTEDEKNLLLIGNKAYTLIEGEAAAPQLGTSLGSVTEYTLQPSLGTGSVISSLVPAGEEVYTVKNAGGLAAAKVNGKMCLFLRSSALGKKPLSGETLQSLLCDPAEVASLSCNGKTLSGAEAVEAMEKLCAEAQLTDEKFSGGKKLTITMSSGLKLTVRLKDGFLACCGTWYCPDFCVHFE